MRNRYVSWTNRLQRRNWTYRTLDHGDEHKIPVQKLHTKSKWLDINQKRKQRDKVTTYMQRNTECNSSHHGDGRDGGGHIHVPYEAYSLFESVRRLWDSTERKQQINSMAKQLCKLAEIIPSRRLFAVSCAAISFPEAGVRQRTKSFAEKLVLVLTDSLGDRNSERFSDCLLGDFSALATPPITPSLKTRIPKPTPDCNQNTRPSICALSVLYY